MAVDIDSRSNAPALRPVRHHAHGERRHDQPVPRRRRVRDRSSTSRYGETGYTHAQRRRRADTDPEGKNAASPLLNVHCRRALAHAIDSQRLAEERGAGLVAAGQRPVPARLDRLPRGHRLPGVRPRRRRRPRWTRACPSSAPTASSSRSTRRTTRSTSRRNTLDHLDVDGGRSATRSQATITPIEQGQYIGLALIGAFQALGWRSHGGIDPDQQRLWWQSASASPIGAPGAQLRALQGRRHRRAPGHHQDQPRPGRPQGGRRGRSTASSASRSTTVETWTLWGILDAAVRQRRRGQRAARRRAGHRAGRCRPPPA